MNKILFLLLAFLAGFSCELAAQQEGIKRQQALEQIALPGSSARWMRLNAKSQFNRNNFFTSNREALDLPQQPEMRLIQQSADAAGNEHLKYQQYHHGYKMLGAEYILHEKSGRIYAAGGNLAGRAASAALPARTIDEDEALSAAMSYAGSRNFLWLDAAACRALAAHQGQNADFYPKGELIWVEKQASGSGDWTLCWGFEIRCTDGISEKIYVDAATGEHVLSLPISIHCDPGTGAATWSGNVGVNTSKSGSDFILLDDCLPANVHVLNGNDSTNPAMATEYTDADNNWTGQVSAIQTFFGVEQTRRYFQSRHARNSFDGAGANIIAYNQAAMDFGSGPNVSNACFDCITNCLTFGDDGTDGTQTDDWNTVDIVGHEFAHGVTKFSAGLTYSNESGALNESFSDIFGEMVELFTNGSADWLVGNDRGAIRSMSNPSSFSTSFGGNMPDTYRGPNWYFGAVDNRGVHHNSSVQNFWFFLLANGGSGTNDNGDPFTVSGIGATKAARIAYANLTTQLVSSSDYEDAKNGSIAAAMDLFGECSDEVIQCVRAWNAVGVNSQDEFGYDLFINCTLSGSAHNLGLEVHSRAVNDLHSDCTYLSNGDLVEYKAGHAVILQPGFSSGDRFHAFIDVCAGIKPPEAGDSQEYEDPTVQPLAPSSPANGNVFSVFPNPSDGRFTVQFRTDGAGEKTSVSVIDATGKKILHRSVEVSEAGMQTLHFNDSELLPGIYFVRLEPGALTAQKLIIR